MTDESPGEADEAEALLRAIEPYARAIPGTAPVPPDLAERIERFGLAHGVDPDNVPVVHVHNNWVTAQSVVSDSWPCPQCIALGRTEPMEYGQDVPDSGSVDVYRVESEQMETEVSDSGSVKFGSVTPEQMEAYLATFPPLDERSEHPPAPKPPVSPLDRKKARRSARRKAEWQARRRNR